MTPQPITSRDNRGNDTVQLSPQHALFADLVAAGESYSQAAETAGFAKDTGRVLARYPAIRARIDQQIGDPDKARCIADYTLAVIRTRDAVSDGTVGDDNWRANMTLHLVALDKLARINGWIIERKQVDKRSLNASVRLQRAEVEAALQADLERLSPGAAGALERLGRPALADDLKAIAAGELVESSPNKSPSSK